MQSILFFALTATFVRNEAFLEAEQVSGAILQSELPKPRNTATAAGIAPSTKTLPAIHAEMKLLQRNSDEDALAAFSDGRGVFDVDLHCRKLDAFVARHKSRHGE